MKYKFRLPIGDWSADGHGKCDYFIIESNHVIDDVMDIYIEMNEVYKVNNVCEEYEESVIDGSFFDLVEEKLNLDRGNYLENYDPTLFTSSFYDFDDEEYGTTTKHIAQLVLDMLMSFDPKLKLKIVNDNIPDFNNWHSGKSVNLPGYGLFY
tara:strand:- start:40368 stop:40823 length:456 start_codon:yes stop_codon:yes gene_type:complete